MPRPEWVQVGRIVRAHGIHGEVRVAVETDNPERFALGSRLFGRPDGRAGGPPRDAADSGSERALLSAEAGRRILVVAGVRGGGGDPIVAFEGVDDRTAAEDLRGTVLEIPLSELPEPGEDEYYPFDLENLEVRTPDGRRVGVVKVLLEAPANDILVVTPDTDPSRELLLPFVMAAVPQVAVAEGYVVVAESFLQDADEA